MVGEVVQFGWVYECEVGWVEYDDGLFVFEVFF